MEFVVDCYFSVDILFIRNLPQNGILHKLKEFSSYIYVILLRHTLLLIIISVHDDGEKLFLL